MHLKIIDHFFLPPKHVIDLAAQHTHLKPHAAFESVSRHTRLTPLSPLGPVALAHGCHRFMTSL